MWQVFLIVFVALPGVEILPCNASFSDIKTRPTRQLDFGDEGKCCPCAAAASSTDSRPPTGDDDEESDEAPESSRMVGPGSGGGGEASNSCSCRWKGDEPIAEPSSAREEVAGAATGETNHYSRLADPAEQKTIFGPEIRLISSVLDTLRVANEEELVEARSRATAMSSDNLASTLLSSRKLLKTSGRTPRTPTADRSPTLRDLNAITLGTGSRGIGAAIIQDNIASSQIISPNSLGRLKAPQRQLLSLFPPSGSLLPKSSKFEDKPFKHLLFPLSQPGNNKGSNSVLAMKGKDNISSRNNIKRGDLLPTIPKKEVPKFFKSKLKEILNKTRANISMKKVLSPIKTSPMVKHYESQSKIASDMADAASSSSIKKVLLKPTTFKVPTEASQLKKTPKIGLQKFIPNSKVTVKQVPLTERSDLQLQHVSNRMNTKHLPNSKGSLSDNKSSLKSAREFDALRIGGRFLDRLDRIRNTIMTALLGKSRLQDNRNDFLTKDVHDINVDTKSVSPKSDDMDSSSSNSEVVKKLSSVCFGTSQSKDHPVVQPEEKPKTILSKMKMKPLLSHWSAQSKETLGGTTSDLLNRQSLIKANSSINADKFKSKEKPFRNFELGDANNKEILSSTKNNKSLEEIECTKCYKNAEVPISMKGEKVFNCKLVCSS